MYPPALTQTYPWECLHDSSHLQSPLHGSGLQTPGRTDSQLGPYHGSTQTHLKNATYGSVKQVHTFFVRQIEKERTDPRVLTVPPRRSHDSYKALRLKGRIRTTHQWRRLDTHNIDKLNKEERSKTNWSLGTYVAVSGSQTPSFLHSMPSQGRCGTE